MDNQPNKMEQETARDRRRRQLLLKNTLLASIGYALPICTLFIARLLNFASYTYSELTIVTIYVVLIRVGSYLFIRSRPRISTFFANSILWFELFSWAIGFIYTLTFLNEIRLAALFFAFITIVFLLTNAGFFQSILFTLFIVAAYTIGSYVDINYYHQAGNFKLEMFYVALFSMGAIFLSLSADIFKKQRREVVNAKIAAEQTAKELAIAKEAAEASDRAKSEFLANMSHELHTPLNHIIGFTDLVVSGNSGELSDTQTKYLCGVLSSSRHLLTLIDGILELSKIESGKMELELTTIQLSSLLEQSLKMVQEKALSHQINLSLKIADDLGTILADEQKLKQILYNLLTNATKFTPDGGQVSLSATRIHNPEQLVTESDTKESTTSVKNWIKISICDSGIGLEDEDLERVFNSFEQADNSANRQYQGAGLGLALTRRLVELHGGRIWAESMGPNRGATFHILIPACLKAKSGSKNYLTLDHSTVADNADNDFGEKNYAVDDQL